MKGHLVRPPRCTGTVTPWSEQHAGPCSWCVADLGLAPATPNARAGVLSTLQPLESCRSMASTRWLWTLTEKVPREWGYRGGIEWPSSPVASQNTLPGILPCVFLFSRRLSPLQETFIFSSPSDKNSAIVVAP